MIKLLQYGSNFFALIPLVVSIIIYKKNLDRKYFIIIMLVIISLSSDMISFFFGWVYGLNYSIMNLYILFEILLVGYFFYLNLDIKKVVLTFTCISLFTFLYLILYINFNSYYGLFLAVNSHINIFWCIWLFYQFFKEEKEFYIERSPVFWINIGLLTYFSGALFTFILSTQILNSPLPYSFLHVANILKNILFAIGLWKVRAVA